MSDKKKKKDLTEEELKKASGAGLHRVPVRDATDASEIGDASDDRGGPNQPNVSLTYLGQYQQAKPSQRAGSIEPNQQP